MSKKPEKPLIFKVLFEVLGLIGEIRPKISAHHTMPVFQLRNRKEQPKCLYFKKSKL